MPTRRRRAARVRRGRRLGQPVGRGDAGAPAGAPPARGRRAATAVRRRPPTSLASPHSTGTRPDQRRLACRWRGAPPRRSGGDPPISLPRRAPEQGEYRAIPASPIGDRPGTDLAGATEARHRARGRGLVIVDLTRDGGSAASVPRGVSRGARRRLDRDRPDGVPGAAGGGPRRRQVPRSVTVPRGRPSRHSAELYHPDRVAGRHGPDGTPSLRAHGDRPGRRHGARRRWRQRARAMRYAEVYRPGRDREATGSLTRPRKLATATLLRTAACSSSAAWATGSRVLAPAELTTPRRAGGRRPGRWRHLGATTPRPCWRADRCSSPEGRRTSRRCWRLPSCTTRSPPAGRRSRRGGTPG